MKREKGTKEKEVKRKREKSLAKWLIIRVTVMLIIVFGALISYTVVTSRTGMQRSIKGQFSETARSNANELQALLDGASDVTADISGYLSEYYTLADEGKKNMTGESYASGEGKSTRTSVVTDTQISELNSDAEVYMVNSAKLAVKENENVTGVGVMFAQNAFDAGISDYSFYATTENADGKVSTLGAFDEYSKEEYYEKAMAAKELVATEPYEYEGTLMVTMSAPIMHADTAVGVAFVDIDVSNFAKIDKKDEQYSSMYCTVYNDIGTIIYDTAEGDITHNMSEFFSDEAQLELVQKQMEKGKAFQVKTNREDGREITRFYNPISVGSQHWWSLTALDTKDMNRTATNMVIWLLVISIASLVVLLVILATILRRKLNPIKEVVGAAESISNGNLDIEIKAGSEDEIGKLALTFDQTAQKLQRIINDADYVLGEMANGNFTVRTKETESYVGDFNGLLESMRKINRSLNETLLQIHVAADQVACGSDQVASGAQALSQGATEQASSIEELAATINEVSEQVKVTAENSQKANRYSETTSEEIDVCGHQMQEMITAMGNISQSSEEIGKIIKTIEDIAFQTNILALNAAVEAARAGSAGKGFAVVADEVRNLAGKSAEAANNTTALIENAIQAVADGTQIAAKTSEALNQVVESTKSVNGLIEEIADAAEEQARAISQVTQGVDQISSVVQTNSATAEESAAASEELTGQSQLLKELVGQFRLEDDSNQ